MKQARLTRMGFYHDSALNPPDEWFRFRDWPEEYESFYDVPGLGSSRI